MFAMSLPEFVFGPSAMLIGTREYFIVFIVLIICASIFLQVCQSSTAKLSVSGKQHIPPSSIVGSSNAAEKRRTSDDPRVCELARKMGACGLPGSLQQHAEESVMDSSARFLKARGGSIDNAFEFARSDAEWRRRVDVEKIAGKSAEDVLQCDPAVVQRFLPHIAHGHDKEGHLVIYKTFGETLVVRDLVKHSSLERLSEYNIWLNEQYVKLLADRSREEKRCISKWRIVIDAKGWHPGLFDKVAYQFLKDMSATDQNHYPERLAGITIVNAPRLLTYCWRVIRTWLDEPTRKKVQICGGEDDWKPTLLELIDEAQLHVDYGGKAVLPDTAEGRAALLIRGSLGPQTGNGRQKLERVTTALITNRRSEDKSSRRSCSILSPCFGGFGKSI